jgi:hypothetical protein
LAGAVVKGFVDPDEEQTEKHLDDSAGSRSSCDRRR